jgi:hypothetical protein
MSGAGVVLGQYLVIVGHVYGLCVLILAMSRNEANFKLLKSFPLRILLSNRVTQRRHCQVPVNHSYPILRTLILRGKRYHGRAHRYPELSTQELRMNDQAVPEAEKRPAIVPVLDRSATTSESNK